MAKKTLKTRLTDAERSKVIRRNAKKPATRKLAMELVGNKLKAQGSRGKSIPKSRRSGTRKGM